MDTEGTMAVSPAESSVTISRLGLRLGSDLLAAATAAGLISPIVCLVDRTIMLRAATSREFAACMKSFLKPISRLPHNLLWGMPARLVCAVYFGTYATANAIDTITNTAAGRPPERVTASFSKFIGTAAVSTSLTVYKDSRMAQYIGPARITKVVPRLTYYLFTTRDAITIFASFNLPTLLAPRLTSLPDPVFNSLKMLQTEAGRLGVAQFLLPAAIQFITTPIHLLGLDLYNRSDCQSFTGRGSRVLRDVWVAVPARVVRIVPAFSVGGILNTSTRTALLQRVEREH